MVVAEIVRVSNKTSRTFCLEAGDVFYTPSIAGESCVDGIFEVAPGFDQPIEDLLVPWDCLTLSGLVITDLASKERIHCVVGPIASDTQNRDWLQFRSDAGVPIGHLRWIPLGRRHHFGTIGGSVELCLTFRNTGEQIDPQPGILQIAHFENTVIKQPNNTVYLNVFDLLPAVVPINSRMCNTMNKSIGFWHCAIEAFGKEWSFHSTEDAGSSGVCESFRPRYHPVHVYKQSINLGTTHLRDWEVDACVADCLSPQWLGCDYNIFTRNCIHFCAALASQLGVKPLPCWVSSAHELGVAVFDPVTFLGRFYSKATVLTNDGSKDASGESDTESEITSTTITDTLTSDRYESQDSTASAATLAHDSDAFS